MLILKVSDEQYWKYAQRLWDAIKNAQSYQELIKLKPSVVMVQQQLTHKRSFSISCILQDYTMKLAKFKNTKAKEVDQNSIDYSNV